MGLDVDDEALQPLHIDLRHLDSELAEIAIADLYAQNAANRLRTRSQFTTHALSRITLISPIHAAYERPDDRLNFAISVMSVANELMLDRLKAVCSDIIRPFGECLAAL